MQKIKPQLPAIICDIDGVLIQDKHPLPHASDMIKLLKRPLQSIDNETYNGIKDHIPFVCLTNAGGMLEKHKSDSLNTLLDLTDDACITPAHIVLNHSPLRNLSSSYHDKIVLLAGVGDLQLVADTLGFKKYITIEEYCTLFPYLVPLTNRSDEASLELRPIIKARLELNDDSSFGKHLKIDAIIILNDVHKWDECIQVMCDVLTDDSDDNDNNTVIYDGMANGDVYPKVKDIPIYACSNDLIYGGKYKLPRIACGGINQTFKHVYTLLFGHEPKITYFGKPELIAFKYTEEYVTNKWKDIQISNFYIIGDNPLTDIKGGNLVGWNTVLVRTGVHRTQENDIENPATYLVNNIKEAIELIFTKEGLLDKFAVCLEQGKISTLFKL